MNRNSGLQKTGIDAERGVAKMDSKLRKLLLHWARGLTTGISAHVTAAIVVVSAERVAYFIGHVVAVIVLQMVK
jgi:hypothetical protein